jgi:hypothetical protein
MMKTKLRGGSGLNKFHHKILQVLPELNESGQAQVYAYITALLLNDDLTRKKPRHGKIIPFRLEGTINE